MVSLSPALAASCLMTLYMANSFHLARTTKLRLALRARVRFIKGEAELFSRESEILIDSDTEVMVDGFAVDQAFPFKNSQLDSCRPEVRRQRVQRDRHSRRTQVA